jgi:hypothetical protein
MQYQLNRVDSRSVLQVGVYMSKVVSDETKAKMRAAALARSPKIEARRVAAIRAPESRAKISEALKLRPQHSKWEETQEKAWAATRAKGLNAYSSIHSWVNRNWGKATTCEKCGKTNLSGRSVHWSNRNHKYALVREDWMTLCRPCHAKHDMEAGLVEFGNKRANATHCKRGHEYTPETTKIYNGCRSCTTCKSERFKENYAPHPKVEKTHCPHGHEYTETNSVFRKGKRECRACNNKRVREWKVRKRAAQV